MQVNEGAWLLLFGKFPVKLPFKVQTMVIPALIVAQTYKPGCVHTLSLYHSSCHIGT